MAWDGVGRRGYTLLPFDYPPITQRQVARRRRPYGGQQQQNPRAGVAMVIYPYSNILM